jgi:hypothetical protein
MAIVSVATLKEYLPEISGSAADTDLSNLIERTESAIARFLGFPVITHSGKYTASLDSASYTLYLDGPDYTDNYVLNIPVRPVTAIASIHSDINQEYGSDTLIDASTYSFDVYLGRVYLSMTDATDTFDRGFRAIKIVCTAGWTSSTAPPDLVHSICVWASQLQRNKPVQGKETTSQRSGSVNISPKVMPPEVKQMLGPMRNFGAIL